MLHEQLKSAFTHFPTDSRVRGWLDAYSIEIETFLHVLVWWFTIAQDKPAPGLKLMGLRYRGGWAVDGASPSRSELPLASWQKLGYLLLAIVIKWLWARAGKLRQDIQPSIDQLRRIVASLPQGHPVREAREAELERAENTVQMQALVLAARAEKVVRVISLANLVAFLFDGKYRTIVDRILGAQVVHENRFSPRNIPFDFMNQQLVFDELTGFVRFVVPYFQSMKSGRGFLAWVPTFNKVTEVTSGNQRTNLNSCVVCGTVSPIMPHAGKCGHVGCYVCLMTQMTKIPNYKCPQCNCPVENLCPYSPDPMAT